jgi:hypothetical protein
MIPLVIALSVVGTALVLRGGILALRPATARAPTARRKPLIAALAVGTAGVIALPLLFGSDDRLSRERAGGAADSPYQRIPQIALDDVAPELGGQGPRAASPSAATPVPGHRAPAPSVVTPDDGPVVPEEGDDGTEGTGGDGGGGGGTTTPAPATPAPEPTTDPSTPAPTTAPETTP